MCRSDSVAWTEGIKLVAITNEYVGAFKGKEIKYTYPVFQAYWEGIRETSLPLSPCAW